VALLSPRRVPKDCKCPFGGLLWRLHQEYMEDQRKRKTERKGPATAPSKGKIAS